MALINMRSGNKVGWYVYDNEAEAYEAAKTAARQAREMMARGYDFGYCSPGEVFQDAPGEWTVVVP